MCVVGLLRFKEGDLDAVTFYRTDGCTNYPELHCKSLFGLIHRADSNEAPRSIRISGVGIAPGSAGWFELAGPFRSTAKILMVSITEGIAGTTSRRPIAASCQRLVVAVGTRGAVMA